MSDVGEIVGRLRLDEGNWFTELDRAQARADELGSADPNVAVTATVADAIKQLTSVQTRADEVGNSDPTVDVKVDTARALTGLATVDRAITEISDASANVRVDADTAAASAGLEALQAQVEAVSDSAGDVTVGADTDEATTKLAALEALLERVSSQAGSVRVTADTATAEAALAALARRADELGARRPTITINADTGTATVQLAAVKTVADAVAASKPTVRVDADTAAAIGKLAAVKSQIDSLSESSSFGASQVALIAAAILSLGPALVPLTAAAVGYAGALGALGATGILAFVGIKNEIAAGTPAGQQYAVMLGSLKGVLDQLGATAAAGVLDGFARSVDEIEGDLPTLNSDVRTFSTLLGTITASGVEGVLGAIQTLNPLLMVAGGLLLQDVDALAQFGQSPEFRGFVAFAASQLPAVNTLLIALAQAAIHILDAFAPVGLTVVSALTGIAQAITAIPTPILTVLAIGATGVATAFLAWRAISGIVTGVTVALQAMTGPIGWISLGVAAAVAVLTSFGAAERDIAQATQTYTAALEAQNSISAQSLRSQVAQIAVQQNLISQGRALGISAATTVDSMLGEVDANRAVVAAIQAHIAAAGDSVSAQAHAKLETDAYLQAVAKSSIATRDAVTAAKQYASAMGGTATASSTAAQAAQTLAGNLNGVYSAVLKLETTSDNATVAIGAMRTQLEQSAKVAKDHAASLNQDSVAGAQNRLAIAGAVDSILKHSQALNEDGKHTAEATQYTESHVGALARQAVAAGASKSQVAGLISELTGMPKSTVTTLLAIDEATPKANAAAASARAFTVAKYAAVLEANHVPVDQAIAAAFAAANKWQQAHPTGTIDADNLPATRAVADAVAKANKFAADTYIAQLKGDPASANTASAAAQARAREFASAAYLAVLNANNGPAKTSSADAQAKARAYADATYQAVLEANNQPAYMSVAGAKARLDAFARLRPNPPIKADPSGAIGGARTAQGAIDSVHGKTVTITTVYNQQGKGSHDYALGGTLGERPGLAAGGTTADYIRSLPGAAGGLSDGTVVGAGHAASDAAGTFRLANREEVTSNLFGQADRFRPILKAINSQAVRTPEQLGQALGGGSGGIVHVYVHGDDSALSGAIRIEAEGVVAEYERNSERTLRMGWQPKGGRA